MGKKIMKKLCCARSKQRNNCEARYSSPPFTLPKERKKEPIRLDFFFESFSQSWKPKQQLWKPKYCKKELQQVTTAFQ